MTRPSEEQWEYLCNLFLAVFSGLGYYTPAEGYKEAPYLIEDDLQKLARDLVVSRHQIRYALEDHFRTLQVHPRTLLREMKIADIDMALAKARNWRDLEVTAANTKLPRRPEPKPYCPYCTCSACSEQNE